MRTNAAAGDRKGSVTLVIDSVILLLPLHSWSSNSSVIECALVGLESCTRVLESEYSTHGKRGEPLGHRRSPPGVQGLTADHCKAKQT